MEVAVVGIGCRFPGDISGPASLWKFLIDKRCAISEIPEDRWNGEAFYTPISDATGWSRSKWGGFINRVFDFDCEFFDISPAEAQRLDPQQRLLLQVAYEAIQDSGQTLGAMSDATTGVFVGISTSDFAGVLRYRNRNDDLWGGSGCALSIAANRISHRLNLKGPSFPVDTACSSALIAIDQACRNIATGMCDQAIAGGVNCLLEPNQFIAFSNANMLSRTGRISTFDEAANGYVRAEGCGLVILRPLEAALRDGDRIYAVVEATAANQDGWTSTLMAPSMKAQEAMLGNLVKRAGVEPGLVNYVEAHGTGTPTGDPIESHAIGHRFGRAERRRPVTIGSVKPNLGHMEPAAGACGFIKTVLSVHHGVVPPNIHFENPNPAIPFDALNIRVPVEAEPMESDGEPHRAVVNSFGWGGANASALVRSLEAAPAKHAKRRATPPRTANGHDGLVVMPLSGHSRDALQRWTEVLADTVAAEKETAATAADLAHAIAHHRDHFPERAVILHDRSAGSLEQSLREAAAEIEANGSGSGDLISARAAGPRRIVFTFSGQGAQWWAMGRGLLKSSTVFSNAIDAFDKHFAPLSGWKVRDVLSASEAKSKVNQGEFAQPALIALQIGLAETWAAYGVKPDAVLGHSLGEISAAYAAGALSLAEVARVMHFRSRIQHQAPERGAMAVVGMTPDEIERFLAPHPSVVISAYNNARTVTISGRAGPLEQVVEALTRHDPKLFLRRLNTDFAWHSELLDYGKEWFRTSLGKVKWTRPRIPFVSTVTGTPQEVLDLDYWWSNLRAPVSYHQAVDWCLGHDYDAFVEIGPDRTVTPLTMAISQDAGGNIAVIHSLERKKTDDEAFKTALARLYVNGVDIDWDHTLGRSGRPTRELPLFPWANETIRFMPREAEAALFNDVVHPLLGRRVFTPRPAWFSDIDVKRIPFLKDHRVGGDIVYPAAAFIEMMLAAVIDYNDEGPVELSSIHFREALSLKPNGTVSTTTYYDPHTGKIEIYARARDSEEDWALRAEAYGWRRNVDLTAFQESSPKGRSSATKIAITDFYILCDRHGLNYGPAFQGVRDVALLGDSSSIANVFVPEAALTAKEKYYFHPSSLDSLLQSSIPLADHEDNLWHMEGRKVEIEDGDDRFKLKLPVSIDRLLWTAPMPDAFASQMWAKNGSVVFAAFDDANQPILRLENLEVRALTLSHSASGDSQPMARYLAEQFLPVDPDEGEADGAEAATGKHWFVVGPEKGAAAPLIKAMVKRGCEVTYSTLASVADDIGDWERGKASAKGEQPVAQVLYSQALGNRLVDGDAVAEGDVAAAAETVITDFIATARALDTYSSGGKPVMLVVLSDRGRPHSADDKLPRSGLAQRSLTGAMRTVANEIQGLRLRSIDVDPAAMKRADDLCRLVTGGIEETEWVVRGERHFVPRVQEMPIETLRPRTELISPAGDRRNYSVSVSKQGSFDNLMLREETTPDCGPGQVLIETASVGLNFRDVMATTGVLPGEPNDNTAWWCNLGGESAGNVLAVGEGVSICKPGDRVIAYGKGLMRRVVAVKENQVSVLPDNVDIADAAAIPVAFLTAAYCLETIAHLRKGERVLIHLGTGGVGLAAIQVANFIGAEIFATAGNDRKRQYLRDLGIKHVMDSRSLSFGDEVLAATDGRGVDVVLNSLAGAAIDVGLGCLAPFGRFVEIGKRDVEEDKPIGLKTLSENKSYSVVDLSVMNQHAPTVAQDLLTETFERLRDGHYTPIPISRFSTDKAGDAMRLMSRAEHIGKIVIEFTDAEIPVRQNMDAPASFRSDRSYLVTGGTSGFGLVLADWLSQKGAGAVHLASRRGTLDEEGQALAAQMRARGTVVMPIALDVTDKADVTAFFREQGSSAHPLAGVFHAAAVLDDGLLAQLDTERVLRVVRPKVVGGWNLHLAGVETDTKLDHFVLFSSIAEVLGSAGQANYAAANAFLCGLADYRHARGLAANAVGLGALSDTGMVARSDSLSGYLDSMGVKPMSNADVIGAFERISRIENPILIFAAVDWPALGRAMPNTATAPRVNALVAASSAKNSLLRSELAASPRDRWADIVGRSVQDEIVKVLKIEGRELPVDQPFAEIGIDSLSAFELKNRIESLADVTLSASRFLQSPTIQGVSQLIAEAIEESDRDRADAEAEAAEPGAKRGDGRRAIPVSAAQSRWLGAAQQSGPGVGIAPIHMVDIALAENVDDDAINTAIEKAASAHPAVRLRAAANNPRELGELATIEVQSGIGGHQNLPGEDGALWSFAHARSEDGAPVLRISAHVAAGDVISVRRVSDEIASSLAGRAGPRAARDVWAEIVDKRHVETGSPEEYAGRGYWREMLARVERPALPRSSALPYVVPALADRHRRVGVFSLGKAGDSLPLPRIDDEEAVVITAFADALGGAAKCDNLVLERWCSGRSQKGRKSTVGPVGYTVPVVIDAIRKDRHGNVAATALMMTEADRHPAFDTSMIEAALGDEMPEVVDRLRQFAVAYVDADALGRARAEELAPALRLEMVSDLGLHVVRHDGEISLELLFDENRVAEADVKSVGDAFVEGLRKLARARRTKKAAAMSWRRNRAAETARADAIGDLVARAVRASRPLSAPQSVIAAADGSLPLSMQQSFLLEALQDRRTTDEFRKFWWVSRVFQVRPSIDLQRLKAAAGAVAMRHDTARTRFIEANGSLRALIEEDFEPHVELRDLGSVSEAELVRTIEALDQDVPDPLTDPLWQITVLRCNGDADVLYVRAHHTVFDGWSTALVIEEMLRAYMGQDLPKADLSLAEYLTKYDRSGDSAALAERESYFRQLLADPPSIPLFDHGMPSGEPNLDLVRAGQAQELVVTVANAQKQAIIERARMSGASPSALLIGAMAQSIADLGGTRDDILICLPMAMRQDLALRSYVGWVATVAPVRCEVSRHRSLDTLAKQVYDQYQTSMLHLPADFTLRRGDLHRELSAGGSYMTLFEAGMLTADASREESSVRDLTRLAADQAVRFAGYEIKPIANGRVRAGCAYHVDIRSFEGPAGHSYRCCYDSDVVTPETARTLFREVLGRLGVSDSSLRSIRENGGLLMDPAAE